MGIARRLAAGCRSATPGRVAVRSLVLLLAVGWGSNLPAQTETTVLRCGQIIDGKSDTPLAGGVILVRGGRIAGLGSAVSIPAGSRELDLRPMTCLPGLIDAHVHLRGTATRPVEGASADKALAILRNAQAMLRYGFTTVRGLGEPDAYYAPISVRNAIARGDFEGPRMVIAPHMMSTTGGHGDHSYLAPDLDVQVPNRVITGGPDGVRQAIREELKAGADWIKIAVTGGVMSAGDNPNVTTMSEAELAAAVDETHRHYKRLTVHAIGTDGIKAAVRAGVDNVEHGILIDDEGIELMKQKGTWLVPTIYVLNHVIDEGAKYGYREESIRKGRALREERDRRIRKAFAAGVKVAFGSDNIFPVKDSAREFAEMVRLGLTPMQAIKTATSNGAQLLELDRELGTLEVGKLADIVAVRSSPIADIRVLEDVQFVMKDGRVIVGVVNP
jgi:imidazolonepropionase-like amidohydrolase